MANEYGFGRDKIFCSCLILFSLSNFLILIFCIYFSVLRFYGRHLRFILYIVALRSLFSILSIHFIKMKFYFYLFCLALSCIVHSSVVSIELVSMRAHERSAIVCSEQNVKCMLTRQRNLFDFFLVGCRLSVFSICLHSKRISFIVKGYVWFIMCDKNALEHVSSAYVFMFISFLPLS